MQERKRVDETLEGFIIYPSQDEGAFFFKTEGLPDEVVNELSQVIQEKSSSGSGVKLNDFINRYRKFQPSERLINLDELIEPFSHNQGPRRIRFVIEDLGDPKLP